MNFYIFDAFSLKYRNLFIFKYIKKNQFNEVSFKTIQILVNSDLFVINGEYWSQFDENQREHLQYKFKSQPQ